MHKGPTKNKVRKKGEPSKSTISSGKGRIMICQFCFESRHSRDACLNKDKYDKLILLLCQLFKLIFSHGVIHHSIEVHCCWRSLAIIKGEAEQRGNRGP